MMCTIRASSSASASASATATAPVTAAAAAGGAAMAAAVGTVRFFPGWDAFQRHVAVMDEAELTRMLEQVLSVATGHEHALELCDLMIEGLQRDVDGVRRLVGKLLISVSSAEAHGVRIAGLICQVLATCIGVCTENDKHAGMRLAMSVLHALSPQLHQSEAADDGVPPRKRARHDRISLSEALRMAGAAPTRALTAECASIADAHTAARAACSLVRALTCHA
eukprot:6185283-Pleurochrysis_carterae.AAC.1